VSIAFDPARHCGARSKRGTGPCKMGKGQRTDHPGAGRCWLHAGRTPGGRRHAAQEAAANALAKLGIPVGTGDPMVLLTKSVQHAEGYLEATGQVLADVAGRTQKPGDTAAAFSVEAAREIYADAIRTAGRVGKAAVDADVADRLAALDERAGDLLKRFVDELLEQVVPAAKRPAMQVWAARRLGELADEYERPVGVVH
jgi:hypothetical protein